MFSNSFACFLKHKQIRKVYSNLIMDVRVLLIIRLLKIMIKSILVWIGWDDISINEYCLDNKVKLYQFIIYKLYVYINLSIYIVVYICLGL